MSSLTLYTYWRSSCSFRVRIALEAKGLAYERIAVNLLDKTQASPEYRKKNPMERVPCLLVDGRPMVESVAIIELLEELFPAPALYPKSAWERAEVRSLVEIINSGVQPLQNTSVLARVSPDANVRKEWTRHFIEHGLAAFEALLERYNRPGPFAYGDALGVADVFLVPQMVAAKRFGADVSKLPRSVRAFEAACATDAVKRALPEGEPDAPRDAAT